MGRSVERGAARFAYGATAETGRNLMTNQAICEKDRRMARRCLECPVCNHARRKQRGLAFYFVKKIEGSVCPFCKAYERVYGRKAHEPRT